jgi:dTDP-4-dehydrorhamnose 3,5-epimerase
MTSNSNVLRGTHVHVTHSDYLTVCTGRVVIGLKDIRPDSQTYGKAQSIVFRGDDAVALTIPTGVVHGFYFSEPTILLYGVSEYWNPSDELGCMWNEPELGLSWPTKTPILSPRDQLAGSFQAMVEAFEKARRKAT